MTDLIPAGTAQFWNSDHNPGASETLQYGILYIGDYVTNTNTGDTFRCIDNTSDSMLWYKMADSNNISSMAITGSLNTSRSYASPSRAFAADYTPSATNDTFVIIPFSQVSVLAGNAIVTLLVDGSTVDTKSCSGLVSTRQDSFTAIVPKGKTYRINSTTTGIGSANTLGAVKELSL